MTTCQICGKDKPVGEKKALYSGRILKEERGSERMTYGGGREVTVTTTYGDFIEHRYFVCSDCHRVWDKVLGWSGGVLTIIATIILLVISVRQHIDWMFALALVVFIAGILVTGQFSTGERLKRQAKHDRGSADPVKVFSETEYTELLEKQNLGQS